MSESTEKAKDLVVELDVERRYGIAQEWAVAAKLVAGTTQHPRALEVWNFINERTTVGVPVPNGTIHYFFRSKPERPITDYAFLTPLIDKDLERLPEADLRRHMAGDSPTLAGQYREGSQAIYLPAVAMSQKGRGVLLLHEGMHAKFDIDKLVDRTVPHSHWIEEAEVFKFEFELLSALFGEKYQKLVNDISASVIESADNASHLRVTHAYTSEERQEVAEWIGTANDRETGLWLGVMQQQAFWEYFKHDKKTQDADTALAQMLRAMYATPENRDL